jgi:hypothetical protein
MSGNMLQHLADAQDLLDLELDEIEASRAKPEVGAVTEPASRPERTHPVKTTAVEVRAELTTHSAVFVPYAEDPPTPGRGGAKGRGRVQQTLAALEALPVGWYVVREFDRSNRASAITSNMRKRHPAFDFKGANVGERSKLYARRKTE